MSEEHREKVILNLRQSTSTRKVNIGSFWSDEIAALLGSVFAFGDSSKVSTVEDNLLNEAQSIASLLAKSTEELTSVVAGLDGGYIKPAPGGGKNVPCSPSCAFLFSQ